MTTMLQYTHADRDAVLEQAAGELARGGTIVFPSDTVYALLACADCQEAYRRIYEVKQRSADKPLALLVAPSHPAVREVVKLLEDYEDEQDAFLCGELTAIFDAGRLKRIPPAVLAIQPGPIGIRLPAWEPLSELLERCDGLLWGTSANTSGKEPEVNAAAIREALVEFCAPVNICVTIEAELPGNVSDVVRFGPHGPELLR